MGDETRTLWIFVILSPFLVLFFEDPGRIFSRCNRKEAVETRMEGALKILIWGDLIGLWWQGMRNMMQKRKVYVVGRKRVKREHGDSNTEGLTAATS